MANAKAYGAEVVQECNAIATGFKKLGDGDLSGLKDIAGALASKKLAPYHALARLTIDTVSAVQVAVGVEPIGRTVNATEEAELRKIFGDRIDYSSVLIKEGGAGVFAGDRALTMGNKIYLKDKLDFGTLVHEMTHVWQFNGGNDYMLKAAYAQFEGWLDGQSGYEWQQQVFNGWENMDAEKQAAFIQEGRQYPAFLQAWTFDWSAYLAKEDAFQRRWPAGARTAVGASSLLGSVDPAQFAARVALDREKNSLEKRRPTFQYEGHNYTVELEAALEKIRRGFGAP